MTRIRVQKRVGLALKRRREALDISQEDFAELVKMHRTYCSLIECGKKNFRVETLEKWCRALKVKMWEILKDADA